MPLFEHMPYTNFENVNLDWILKTIKEHETKLADHETRITALEATTTTITNEITVIEGDITNINNEITEITNILDNLDITELTQQVAENTADIAELEQAIEGLDLSALWSAINTNNAASIARDDALSARIALLEEATIHDINNYYNEGNQLLFGSDLRKLPDECLGLSTSGSFPISYGDWYDRPGYEGQQKSRSFMYVKNYGFCPDIESSGYDYYQMGRVARFFGNRTFTLTFALAGTSDNTTPVWYSHTFADSNESWDIATGCQITIYQGIVQFKGTAENWENNVFDGKYMVFAYLEYGSGSVPHDANQKPLYDAKDRLFFLDPVASSIRKGTYFSQPRAGLKQQVMVKKRDLPGQVYDYSLDVWAQLRGYWYDDMFAGYIELIIKDSSSISGQDENLTQEGCYFDVTFSIPDPLVPGDPDIPVEAAGAYGHHSSVAKNIDIDVELAASSGALNTDRINVTVKSSGLAIGADGSGNPRTYTQRINFQQYI